MWIKTIDLKPETHEIILFQDRWRNEHYGVLCGEFSEENKRNKYWCHIFQRSYKQKDIIYWCEIPINRHLIRNNHDFEIKVNKFLWDTISTVEDGILQDFKQHRKDNPEWDSESLVGIAVRNTCWRIMDILKGTR